MERVALDSNILIYAEGLERSPSDATKVKAASGLIAILTHRSEIVVAAQALAELYHVLIRRGRFDRARAAIAVGRFRESYETRPTTLAIFDDALRLAAEHQFSIWDAIIVTVAADAGCVLLLSEDMQDGFVHRGMTIANPFAPVLDARLASLLAP